MDKVENFKRVRDIYGNIIKETRVYSGEDGIERGEWEYEYDPCGRIIGKIHCTVSPNVTSISKTTHIYEDDELGNKIKETIYVKHIEIDKEGNETIVGERSSIWSYKNVYTEWGELVNITFYRDGRCCNTREYKYRGGVLWLEIFINKSNELYKIYYRYNSKGELIEKEFHTRTDNIGYYHHYQKRMDGRYAYTLQNPEKSRYKWRVDNVEDDCIYMVFMEDFTTCEVYEEIYRYVIREYPDIRQIYGCCQETFIREKDMIGIDRIVGHYKDKYGIDIKYYN